MCSSGPSRRSAGVREASVRVMMRSVTSGESKLRPSELAYLRKIMSRTSSTKSSSLIITMVADAPGRLTHILRVNMLAGISGAEGWLLEWAGEARDWTMPGSMWLCKSGVDDVVGADSEWSVLFETAGDEECWGCWSFSLYASRLVSSSSCLGLW